MEKGRVGFWSTWSTWPQVPSTLWSSTSKYKYFSFFQTPSTSKYSSTHNLYLSTSTQVQVLYLTQPCLALSFLMEMIYLGQTKKNVFVSRYPACLKTSTWSYSFYQHTEKYLCPVLIFAKKNVRLVLIFAHTKSCPSCPEFWPAVMENKLFLFCLALYENFIFKTR